MLIRYGKDEKGRLIRQAKVYTLKEHGISRDKLDPDALKVTERLRNAGYQAYVVGGAVRDLLINKEPKDYDIATDAYPSRVRKIFRNSRIIGKRFRLVHVYFPDNKILEVATFRSLDGKDGQNIYGSIDEDARRRDFTLNALYYSPKEEQIIDYHDGVKDIRKNRLKSVIPLNTTFVEDPVRMLRAVKYSVTTSSKIPFKLKKSIKKHSSLLKDVSVSRMTEEIFKILQSSYAAPIFHRCREMQLFEYLLPQIHEEMNRSGSGKDFTKKFFSDMDKLDKYTRREGKMKARSRMLQYLTQSWLDQSGALSAGEDCVFMDVVGELKNSLKPMIAPNREVMDAVKHIFKKNKWKMPRRRPSYRGSTKKSFHKGSQKALAKASNPVQS
ncbi:MAG: hypothetical protein B6241_00865 [Spirochaetaceae bacterium 4572_59]|nr:MAG: hypothetical protein B6241_00865 [Spirochaetaceae bacterium 4572_59]